MSDREGFEDDPMSYGVPKSKSVERRLEMQKERPGAFERLRELVSDDEIPGAITPTAVTIGACIALAEEMAQDAIHRLQNNEKAEAHENYAARLKEAIGE